MSVCGLQLARSCTRCGMHGWSLVLGNTLTSWRFDGSTARCGAKWFRRGLASGTCPRLERRRQPPPAAVAFTDHAGREPRLTSPAASMRPRSTNRRALQCLPRDGSPGWNARRMGRHDSVAVGSRPTTRASSTRPLYVAGGSTHYPSTSKASGSAPINADGSLGAWMRRLSASQAAHVHQLAGR